MSSHASQLRYCTMPCTGRSAALVPCSKARAHAAPWRLHAPERPQRSDREPATLRGRHYGRELAAYDVQTRRCDVYGQDAGLSERGMLVYDGLHYDALALAGAPSGRRADPLRAPAVPARGTQAQPDRLKQLHLSIQ